MAHECLLPLTRSLIAVFVPISSSMTRLGRTVANVACLACVASTSARREQVTRVLKSYVIFTVMFTPLSG